MNEIQDDIEAAYLKALNRPNQPPEYFNGLVNELSAFERAIASLRTIAQRRHREAEAAAQRVE